MIFQIGFLKLLFYSQPHCQVVEYHFQLQAQVACQTQAPLAVVLTFQKILPLHFQCFYFIQLFSSLKQMCFFPCLKVLELFLLNYLLSTLSLIVTLTLFQGKAFSLQCKINQISQDSNNIFHQVDHYNHQSACMFLGELPFLIQWVSCHDSPGSSPKGEKRRFQQGKVGGQLQAMWDRGPFDGK